MRDAAPARIQFDTTVRDLPSALCGNARPFTREEPALERHGQPGLLLRRGHVWHQPAHQIQPILVGIVDHHALRVQLAIGGDREPEAGWIGLEPVAVELGCGHADDRHGHTVEIDGGSGDGRIPIERVLPVAETDHAHRRRRRRIVERGDGATRGRIHSEHLEIVPGYEPGSRRPRRAPTGATYAHLGIRALEGAEAVEHVRIPEMLVERMGIHGKGPVRAGANARAPGVPEHDQTARIVYGQRLHQHGID